MFDLIFFFILLIFVIKTIRLSKRISACEEKLTSLERLQDQPSAIPAPDPSTAQTPQHFEITKQVPIRQEKPRDTTKTRVNNTRPRMQFLKQSIKIPSLIKDNWLAAIGLMACVIGAVFFGITSGLFNRPEVRIIALSVFSALLLVLSIKLKEHWRVLKSLLRSAAGAIILFSAVGAGYLEGLRCIHSSPFSVCLLCAGALINLYLATITPFQMIASAHVLYSILALLIAPQHLLFLPFSALVTLIGMSIAYRSKWDLHLILILIGFSVQNMVWTRGLNLETWMHYLAAACIVIISLVAATIHYSKLYRSKKSETLPFIAHLTNWALLTWNLYTHLELFQWSCFVLLSIALIGFFLARLAKKKEITWLYHTDTCLSLLVALSAVGVLSKFSVGYLDLFILMIIQVALFNLVHHLLKETLLLRIGYTLQTLLTFSFLSVSAGALSISESPIPHYFRIGGVIAINWALHIYGSWKSFFVDSFHFLFFGDNTENNRESLTVTCSTLLCLLLWVAGSKNLLIQGIVPLVLFSIGILRTKKADTTWDLSFVLMFSFIHLYSAIQLLSQTDIGPRIDFLALIAIDLILLFRRKLDLKIWKKEISHLVLYALALQIGLVTHVYCKSISSYIPPLTFLGYALIALEGAKFTQSRKTIDPIIKDKILTSLLHVGAGFFLSYLYFFITVHLQMEENWQGISLRILSEVLGCCTLCYWIVYGRRTFPDTKFTRFIKEGFIELLLGFITLVVFTESPDIGRPLVWAGIALGLIIGIKQFQWKRKRLLTWSWVYLIASVVHVAMITGYLVTPGQSNIFYSTVPAICLQLIFAFMAYRNHHQHFLYRSPTLTILLPVFLGLALYFAFNYERALLTLFWVGLSCLYLALSLLAKSRGGLYIAMTTLIICSIRLVVFDLVASNTTVRAIVFLGVGVLMVLIGMTYKKFKHRIEAS